MTICSTAPIGQSMALAMITHRAVELFALLANETRLGISTELIQATSGGLTINELVPHVLSSSSTVRCQIAILVETGLVHRQAEKRQHEFWANTVLMNTLRDFMADQLGNAPAIHVDDITSAYHQNGIFTAPATQSHHSLCDRLAEVNGAAANKLAFGEPASVAIGGVQKSVR